MSTRRTTKAGAQNAPTAASTDWRGRFPEFAAAVEARCEKGAATYGDASFGRPVAELLDEVEEELLDVAGWAFVLWTRLRALRGGDHAAE